MVVKVWRCRWENLTPFPSYPEPIRRVIYGTNAVESLNAQLQKTMKKRGAFPADDCVRNVLYLAIMRASENWRMPIQKWAGALNCLNLTFRGRLLVNP